MSHDDLHTTVTYPPVADCIPDVRYTEFEHDAFGVFRDYHLEAEWHIEWADDIEGFRSYPLAELDYIILTLGTQEVRLHKGQVDRDVWSDVQVLCADALAEEE